MWTHAGRWTFLALLATAACGAERPDGDLASGSLAIQGGVLDSDDTEVMALYREFSPIIFASVCTATLIAPNVAITARHCIQDHDGLGCDAKFKGPIYPYVWISPVADTNGSGGTAYAAAQVLTPNSDPGLCNNDVALLVLKNVIPTSVATSRALRLDPLGVGDAFSAVGYGGVDSSGTSDGIRRRYDGAQVFCIGSTCPGGQPGEWLGTAPLCPGDSGGPALDASGQVAGVASRGDCSLAVYTRLECFAGWIRDTVVDAANAAGYPAPAWTSLEAGTVQCKKSSPVDGGSGSGGTSSGGSGGTSEDAGVSGSAGLGPGGTSSGGAFGTGGTTAPDAGAQPAGATSGSGSGCRAGSGSGNRFGALLALALAALFVRRRRGAANDD